MIALAGGVPDVCGLIGVTRLIDTGAATGVTPWLAIEPLPGVVTSRITVPVKVPFGRPVGSANTMRSTPSGGKTPLDGCTLLSHGLSSSCAVNGRVWPGNPGT